MKRIVLLIVGLIYTTILFSQVPDSFTYQTLIRNSSGEPIANTDVRFSLSILEGSTEGLPVFTETQLVKSNSFGVCNLKIGTGDDASSILSSLNWGTGKFFLKISIDETGNNDYTEIGIVELLSVPYSFYSNESANARKSDSALVAKSLDEEVLYFTDSDTLFAVKDRNGNIVFAVFPDGAKVYVNQGVKGNVGGFAVTGRNPTKAILEEEFLRVTPDSTRIWVNENVKGRVGGFAVTGRNPTKGINNNYIEITKDSTRIYVTEDATKGRVGGFAVTGRNPTKGELGKDYFNVSGNKGADIINNESRIIWYPQKAALMAGEVHVGSADSVGTNSTALGYRNIAKGNYSQAFGYKAQSLGENSSAIGNSSKAMGDESYAFGNFAESRDTGSYAIGTGAIASGLRSFAIGSTGVDSSGVSTSPTKAEGDYAYAFGMGSVATSKGAFAIGTQDTTSGNYALSMGYQSKSTDWGATAIGYRATASKGGSIAMGFESEAGSHYSTAIGYRATTSNGWFALALGERTSASGFTAVSIGRSNDASGNISTAIGYQNTASNGGSAAFGSNNISSGEYSLALGYNTNATGNYSISLGQYSIASALNSISIGYESVANYLYGIAIGYQDTASGAYALATGRGTKSSGTASFSTGDITNASGQGAFSAGYKTNASGFASIAAGSQSKASGSYSFATGYNTNASYFGAATFGYQTTGTGRYTLTAGYETTAQAYSSMVVGRYNIITGNTSSWISSDPLFVVGNGTGDSNRSDALVVLKSGDMKLKGNFYPVNNNLFDIGTSTFRWDDIYATNNVIQTSDKRFKNNIDDLNYGLKEIMQLRPVTFIWKDNPEKGLKIGLIAQEVQPVLKEVVNVGDDEDNTLGITYTDLIPVLIKGMQEQENKIENLQKENEELKQKLNEIIELLNKE